MAACVDREPSIMTGPTIRTDTGDFCSIGVWPRELIKPKRHQNG
jgi:hypothetical protein